MGIHEKANRIVRERAQENFSHAIDKMEIHNKFPTGDPYPIINELNFLLDVVSPGAAMEYKVIGGQIVAELLDLDV